ncbi:hypothetical protein SAMN04487926_10319 [Paraburkholderia steynii]|uniref:GIY-YIG domain-containing protein n=1 Tax=Paraburkholderia steynii TaxID=1245441 RepID=A0A7Z7B204_9BURK|nr:hypothetical protein [Paraburkholderia steynii]SDH23959.1 hypothetical protein SAMN04487926_10319 [Paraburkholderia steynii]
MGLSFKLTNEGIQISFGEEPERKLEPAGDADQAHPRKSYVYAHQDEAGNIFYIGKGIERRAWSDDRHPLWTRYVEKHLGGKYIVRILRDNLLPADAEELESAWISQCGDRLVNWINMGRKTDFEALDRFHKLRNANRTLIAQGKSIEKVDCAQAVAIYVRAIESIAAYASIRYEGGLVGQLLDEDNAEWGSTGEIEALDRLTLCLVKLGRGQDAKDRADHYFQLYRRDMALATADRIVKRIDKALSGEKAGRSAQP